MQDDQIDQELGRRDQYEMEFEEAVPQYPEPRSQKLTEDNLSKLGESRQRSRGSKRALKSGKSGTKGRNKKPAWATTEK